MDDLPSVALSLVGRFDRMVRRDGGKVRLIAADGDTIRIGYRPGSAESCVEGVCVMPEAELHAMMSEVLAAQAPNARLQLVRTAD